MSLLPEARYDEIMAAFGGRGFLVRTVEELREAVQLSLSDWERPSLINVLIDPSSDRKQQVTGTSRESVVSSRAAQAEKSESSGVWL